MKCSVWVANSLVLICIYAAATAVAHEVRPALLKISEVSDQKFLVSWKVPAVGERRLAIAPEFAAGFTPSPERVSGFSSGASIQSWYIAGRALADTDIVFTNLSSTMTDVLVQVSFQDGRYQTGLVRPSAPVFHVSARDSHFKVFESYLVLGIEHILLGSDHLLFVLGMILLVTDRKRLLWAVTGFTIAHSITLALATLDIIHVPAPPVEAIIALSQRGVPVCAHLGLTPQSVNKLGGYKVQGKGSDAAEEMLNTALRLEAAGADMILLECVPNSLADKITQAVNVPVIGIGAGNVTDGQVLVMHDLLGISGGHTPKFVKNFFEDASTIQEAFAHYDAQVKSGDFPSKDYSFGG